MRNALHHNLCGFAVAFLLGGCAATPNEPTAWLNMPTFNPATVRQDVPGYISHVVDMLLASRLLRP